MPKPFLVLPPLLPWTPEQILEKFRLEDGIHNIFQIGCCSRKVTIFSQQQRALNLAYALHASGELENKTISILGSGFAGLMIASALRILGYEFSIFDRSGHELHLQRGNLTRFVQPYIYEWPLTGCGYPRTELPYLNWWSSYAGEIVDSVLHQWNRLAIPIIRKSVKRIESGQVTRIHWEDGDVTDTDITIIAVGFGLERGVKETTVSSYWSNDSLTQSQLGKQIPAKVLVSGPGDGGLIDVIRSALVNFNHKNFVRNFIFKNNFYDTFLEAALTGNNNALNWNEIVFPEAVLNELTEALRPDTEVIFNADVDWFRSEFSALFNRLIVAMLLRVQNSTVRFVPGKLIHSCRETAENRWLALIQADDGTVSKFYPDHLVLRHGVNAECPLIVDKEIWDATTENWQTELNHPNMDRSALSHYSFGFLYDESMEFCGELEYEVVFIANANKSAELIERVWQRAEDPEELVFERTPNSLVLGFIKTPEQWPTSTASLLRVRTGSKRNLHSFMSSLNEPYYAFGVKVSPERIFVEEEDTEAFPFVPYVFPGAVIELCFWGAGEDPKSKLFPMWIRVIQRYPDEGYELRDAHNLLDGATMLEIARKKWTLDRMVALGWRLTARTETNWLSFFDYKGANI